TASTSLDEVPLTPLKSPSALPVDRHVVPSKWTKAPPKPTTQTSFAAVPQTARQPSFGAPLNAVHPVPLKWRITPPTANTSLGPEPQSPNKYCVVPLCITVQALPSNRTIVPESPTAKTLRGDEPHTRCRYRVVALGIGFQLVPSKCTMWPRLPTANRSVPDEPQMPSSS